VLCLKYFSVGMADQQQTNSDQDEEIGIIDVMESLGLTQATLNHLTASEIEMLASLDERQLSELGMVLDGTLAVEDVSEDSYTHESEGQISNCDELSLPVPREQMMSNDDMKVERTEQIAIHRNRRSVETFEEKKVVTDSRGFSTRWMARANTLISKAMEYQGREEWNRAISNYIFAGEILIEALALKNSAPVQIIIKKSIEHCLESVEWIKKFLNQDHKAKVYSALKMLKEAEKLERSEMILEARNLYEKAGKQLNSSLPEVIDDIEIHALAKSGLMVCIQKQNAIERRLPIERKIAEDRLSRCINPSVLPLQGLDNLELTLRSEDHKKKKEFLIGDRVTIMGFTTKSRYDGVICGRLENGRYPVLLWLPGRERKVIEVRLKDLWLSRAEKARVSLDNQYLISVTRADTFPVQKSKQEIFWPLPPDIAMHICGFLPYSDLPRLGQVCKTWRLAIYSHSYSRIWRTIVIGADPLQNGYGQATELKWLLLSGVTEYVETLMISKGMIGEFFSDEESERYLAMLNMPRLRSLVIYSTPVEDYSPIFRNHSNLSFFFTEDRINLRVTLESLPHLRALSSSIIDVEEFIGLESEWKGMEYVSCIFGVNSRNVSWIFSTFPQLKWVALEVEDVIPDLHIWCQQTELRTLNISWKPGKFLMKSRTQTAGLEDVVAGCQDVVRWLRNFSFLDVLIIDGDYVFDGGSSLLEEARLLLPSVQVKTSAQHTSNSLQNFWKYIGEN